MAFGFLFAQLLNMLILLSLVAIPVAAVTWVVMNSRKSSTTDEKLLLQKLHDESYIRVSLDDVEKVDIVDDYEAVIHLAHEQKLIVKPDEARRVIRKLR